MIGRSLFLYLIIRKNQNFFFYPNSETFQLIFKPYYAVNKI